MVLKTRDGKCILCRLNLGDSAFKELRDYSSFFGEKGEITKSLGNIYSQDVPTGRPGTSLYDVLQSF